MKITTVRTLFIMLLVLVLAAGMVQGQSRTPLYTERTPGGILTILNETEFPGFVFWVDSGNSNASDDAGYGFGPDAPFATIDYAIGQCTASNGDVIFAMPGHIDTMSVSASITVDVAGVSIIGLGEGRLMPEIVSKDTVDCINVTAANVRIENLQFTAPTLDDTKSDINIAAGGCVIRNTVHIGSTTAKNKTDIITIAAAGNDFLLDGLRIYNVTVDCVGGISIEGACARGEIRDCMIQGNFSTAALMDEATATLLYIHDNIIKNTKAATAVVSFSNNSTGVFSKNFVSGRHTTLASNMALGTGMDYHENRLVEEAALNGAIYPAADTD